MSTLNVERSREKIALSRDAVQKKTFTKWINSHLMKVGVVVEDLYFDLRDGRNLILLLELLTDSKLPREKGNLRFHRIQDINTVLKCIERRKIDTINIESSDILDGNAKLTLGLVWRLILHFQISTVTAQDDEGRSGPVSEVKQIILKWCRAATEGYQGVAVNNFTTSWKDGLAFNAILNRFRPDLVDFDSLHADNNMANLQQAFTVAEKELGVIQLLDAEDFNMAVPDENSILTYVSLLIKSLPDNIPPHPKYIAASEKWAEYGGVAEPLLAGIDERMAWLESSSSLTDANGLKDAIQKAGEFQQRTLPVWAASKERAEVLSQEVEVLNTGLIPQFAIKEEISFPVVEEAWSELLQAFDRNVELWNDALKRCEVLDQNTRLQQEARHLQDLLEAQAETVATIEELSNSSNDSEASKERLEEISVQLEGLERDIVALDSQLNINITELTCADSMRQQLAALRTSHSQLKERIQHQVSTLGQQSSEVAAFCGTYDLHSSWMKDHEESLQTAQWSADKAIVVQQLDSHQKVHSELLARCEVIRAFCEQETNPGVPDLDLSALESRVKSLKVESSSRLNLLQLSLDAMGLLEWIEAQLEPELVRDLATADADDMADNQVRLNAAMDSKEEDVLTLSERFDKVIAPNLSAPARKAMQSIRKAVDEKWQELENVYNSLEINIGLVEDYQEAKEKVEDCALRMQDAKELLEKASTDAQLAEVEETISDLNEVAKEISKLLVDVSPLHKRHEPAPKKYFVRAVSNMTVGKRTLTHTEECLLIDNSDRRYWKVATTAGSFLVLPSPLLMFPPPAPDLSATIQGVEADVSECRDQVQTIRKQRDVDSKKTSFLSEAEYILALKVDENFDSMIESREDLLQRCRKLIPDLMAEGDSEAIEKLQAAEDHWQTLCKARDESKVAPYLEFSEWLGSVERQLVGQSDLPRSLSAVGAGVQEPLTTLLLEVRGHEPHCAVLEQLKKDYAEDKDLCSKVNNVLARYRTAEEECCKRAEHLELLMSGAVSYETSHTGLVAWLDKAEYDLGQIDSQSTDHEILKKQVAACKALQCDAESQEEAFTSCLNAGEVACYEAQTWQTILTGYMEQLKGLCTSEELHEMSSAVAEEQDEAPLMIDEIPDELVAVSERYEALLMALKRDEKRINQQLTKSGRVHDLLDEVAAWLKESERIALTECRELVPANLDAIENHLDVLDELESGAQVQDALMMQALAAYEDFVDSTPARDSPDQPTMVTSLNDKLQAFRASSSRRKQALRNLHGQTEVFDRQCTEQLYWLASAEGAAKQHEAPSLVLAQLDEQIKQHDAFHKSVQEKQPMIEKVKASGETLLSNAAADATSKSLHRGRLTELLSCNGHLLLQSSARQKQLASMKENLENFTNQLEPSSVWIGGFEEQMCIDGPPAVDTPTLKTQMDRVETRHRTLQDQSKSLAEVLASGQKVLLTSYMTSSSHVTVTHKTKETDRETGDVLREEASVEHSERQQSASPALTVRHPTGTVSLGDLPPDRFVIERISRGEETDSAVRVDVLKIAQEAVEDGSANWVQKKCVELPKRFQDAGQSCVVRIRELATMKAHVDNFDSNFAPMATWLEECKTRLEEQKFSASDVDTMSPDALQQQLQSVKLFLQGLSEQSSRVTVVIDTGRGVIDKHNTALDSLKEQVATLSAHRGEAIVSADSLDKDTAPGVIALQDKLDAFQALWDSLNSTLQSRHAELEATFTASKDLSEAVETLANEIAEVDQLSLGLKLLSADRNELTQQVDDLKVVNRKLATVQTKLSTLGTSSASSPTMKRSFAKMQEDCSDLSAKLNRREKAIASCQAFLDSLENVQPWIAEKEAYIAALPTTNTDLLKAFALGVKTEEGTVKAVIQQSSTLAEDYSGLLDEQRYQEVSSALEDQHQALNVAAGAGFKNAVAEIDKDASQCERDIDSLVINVAFPVTSGGMKAQQERVEDVGRSVLSTQQKLEKVSEALKDLSAQSVDDSVVSPAVSSTVSVKKKVEAASSKIEESSVVLAAGVLLAESFEESRSSVGCKLNDYDSVFGLLSDDVGDDGVVLSKQADEIKAFIADMQGDQHIFDGFEEKGDKLVEFCQARLAKERDTSQVSDSVRKDEMHYRKLLEDTKATLVDVETQLANVQAFDKQAQALNGWLDEQLVQLGEQTDSAQTLSISSLETKLQTLEVISEGIVTHEADKSALWKSSLRIAEAKKRGRLAKPVAGVSVGEKASQVEQKWSDVASLIEKRRHELDLSLKRASATTGDIAQVEKWLQASKSRVDDLPVCACVPDLVDQQLKELETVHGELQADSGLLSDVISKCSELGPDDPLQTRLASAQKQYEAIQNSLEVHRSDYKNGRLEAEKFALDSAQAVETLSSIAEESSTILLKQPPSSLEALESEKHAAELLKQQLAAVEAVTPAIFKCCESLLLPIGEVQRQGGALVQARRDELQNLLEQISKDIDAHQKHLEDTSRVAAIFYKKCEDVEGPFAEMEKLLNIHNGSKDDSDTQAHSADSTVDTKQNGDVRKIPATQLMSIIQELATKEPNIQDIQSAAEDLKKACDPDYHADIDQQVDNIVTRWHQLQREAMQKLGEMETAAKYALGFQEKLEPFLEWLADFETMASLKIGLTHSEIEAVFHDVQAMEDTLTLQTAELEDLWIAAGELMDQAGAASGRVQQEMDSIQERFNQQTSNVSARLEKVQLAMHAATAFEHPFQDLMNEKSALEVSVLHPEPLTGSLEDSQQMLLDTQNVHEKTMMLAPQVETAFQAGESLLALCEVGQQEKEKFHDDLDDFQAGWGVLQLRAGLRIEKLRSAISQIETFVYTHLNPMLEWIGGAEDVIAPTFLAANDIAALEMYCDSLEAIKKGITDHEPQYKAAEDFGNKLIKDVLDDPFVTEEQVIEMTLRWEKIKTQVIEREREAQGSIAEKKVLDVELLAAHEWLDTAQTQLSAMSTVSLVDLSSVEAQLHEIQEFSMSLDGKFPEITALLERGRAMLAVDPTGRRTSHTDMMDEIDQQCSDLQYQTNERIVDVEAAILALRGLQDAVSEMSANIQTIDSKLRESEAEVISSDLPGVRAQLDIVKLLQEDMRHLTPKMDVLSKTLRDATRQDKACLDKDPQMKEIFELQHKWKSLWLRVSQRQAQFEDVVGHLNEAEAVKHFDYDAWRDKFVQWLDGNNVRVSDMFTWSDGQLKRKDFISGLERYHRTYPVSRVEKELIADRFDLGDGFIDYWAFASGLRPEREVKFKHKPRNEAEQVDQEVRTAVSHCTCAKQFHVEQIGDAKYMFGDSQMIRMVRILRTLVMVRVGGGWQSLEEFLNKHDPCRAQANADMMRSLLRSRKLSGNAVKHDKMSKFTSHTQSTLSKRHNQTLQAAAADPQAEISTKVSNNRRQTVVTKRTTVERGKERPHVIAGDGSSPRVHRTYKVETAVHSAECGQHQKPTTYSPFGETPRSAIKTTSATSARQAQSGGGRTTPIKPVAAAAAGTGSPALASPRSPKLRRKSSFSKIPVPRSAGQSKIPTPNRR